MVSGGKIGHDNMTMPIDYGYIFGGGRGEVVDPQNDPDIDFKTYVKETYVTVKDNAFVLGGVRKPSTPLASQKRIASSCAHQTSSFS